MAIIGHELKILETGFSFQHLWQGPLVDSMVRHSSMGFRLCGFVGGIYDSLLKA